MADAVIVPPVPQINQTDSPEQIAHTLENVQKIFDKVAPKIRGTPTPEVIEQKSEPQKPAETPSAPVAEPAQSTQEPVEKLPETPQTPSEHKLPSFLDDALKVEQKQETPAVADDEWPEEVPEFKTPEERKTRYKAWRDKYNQLKTELKAAKSQPALNPELEQKLSYLESQNKEMQQVLERTGIERSRKFQREILAPMNAAWNEAARIVKDTGGDPQQLSKALSMQGKEHFEALDEIFSGMPESAKIEVNNAVAAYRRHDAARVRALANAPQTAAEIKKSELQEQYATIQHQRKEMEGMWEVAGRKLRDEAKLEVMQRSANPEDAWWNDQIDADEATSKRLFLDNTDMDKVAMCMRLAPLVDRYRQLWQVERAARQKSENILKEKFGSEPSLSESGGNVRNGLTDPKDDLKKPFNDVFLREFHKQRNAGVR